MSKIGMDTMQHVLDIYLEYSVARRRFEKD